MLTTATPSSFARAAMTVAFLLPFSHLRAQQGNAAPPLPPAADTSGDAAFLSNTPSALSPDASPSPEAAPPASNAPSADSLTPPPLTSPTAAPKTPSSETVSRAEERALSLRGPDAESPFFVERQEAKAALAREAREGFGMYVPKPPHPPVGQQVRKFFRGMFGGGRDGAGAPQQISMTVEPKDFSLAATGELDVTLRLTNRKRHEIELLYPDNQRLEILVKDSSGALVSKWSQDRAFDRTEGYVEVNPREFISYTERLSTAGMKPGVTYTVEVSIANQTGFAASQTVTPRP